MNLNKDQDLQADEKKDDVVAAPAVITDRRCERINGGQDASTSDNKTAADCGDGTADANDVADDIATITDETQYEHGFERGMHVIRWDMLPILWPIQIHGIVLEVSEDKTTVTMCDFGITAVQEDSDRGAGAAAKVRKPIKKMVTNAASPMGNDNEGGAAGDTAGIDRIAMSLDGGTVLTKPQTTALLWDIEETSDGSYFPFSSKCKVLYKNRSVECNRESLSMKDVQKSLPLFTKNKRLNVITLTKWSDLRKWTKVNYDRNLSEGVGEGIKKIGKKTEQWLSSVSQSVNGRARTTISHITKNIGNEKSARERRRSDYDESDQLVEMRTITPASSSCERDEKKCGSDGGYNIYSYPRPSSASSETSATTPKISGPGKESKKLRPPSELWKGGGDHEACVESEAAPIITESSIIGVEESTITKTDSYMDKPKTLAEMVAEANKIDEQTRIIKVNPRSPEKKKATTTENMEKNNSSWRGNLFKSFSNLLPQNNDGEKDPFATKCDGLEGRATATTQPQSSSPNDEPKTLPKSDPSVLVLARVRFLLERGEEYLPPYHIVNSNSECVAVWCMTGRWSTLQAAVFLHSTAIGNAKSSTALALGVAATQPWLFPAMAGVGIAAVGTPWLMLKFANDKWNEATSNLNDEFWSQAEPEVFVECIEKWSSVTLE